jgi:hypothetical protein
VVKAPERWPRIVELARAIRREAAGGTRFGRAERVPAAPQAGRSGALPDISLSVLKLMGPGEYVLMRPGDPEQGHFGLAAHDYTHSTAPNRRFADLVTQRLLKALPGKPYSDAELDSPSRATAR